MTKYYALFDNEEIGDKRYALGEPINGDDVHPAVLQILESQGRLSTNPPTSSSVVTADKSVDEMNRSELEAGAMEALRSRMAEQTDDTLRGVVQAHRDKVEDGKSEDGEHGDGSTGGTPYADLKDKPLGSLKTADLDTIAREENVSFEGAKTNPDRVKAIEAARANAS